MLTKYCMQSFKMDIEEFNDNEIVNITKNLNKKIKSVKDIDKLIDNLKNEQVKIKEEEKNKKKLIDHEYRGKKHKIQPKYVEKDEAKYERVVIPFLQNDSFEGLKSIGDLIYLMKNLTNIHVKISTEQLILAFKELQLPEILKQLKKQIKLGCKFSRSKKKEVIIKINIFLEIHKEDKIMKILQKNNNFIKLIIRILKNKDVQLLGFCSLKLSVLFLEFLLFII